MKLVLASSSPRRMEFLKQLHLPFEIIKPAVEERPKSREAPAHFARRAAIDKAQSVATLLRATGKEPDWLIIAADTIVVFRKQILGKPKLAADARKMLRLLSGHWHQVISGLCVMSQTKSTSIVVSTDVEFKHLTRQEIECYIASGEPMDKAGAYAIQGRGSFMIRAIRGSYTNVVGLPLAELLDILRNNYGLNWQALA